MLSTSLYLRFGKRLFDLLVAVPLFILLSPLMLLIGLCSLLFYGGSPHKSQRRSCEHQCRAFTRRRLECSQYE